MFFSLIDNSDFSPYVLMDVMYLWKVVKKGFELKNYHYWITICDILVVCDISIQIINNVCREKYKYLEKSKNKLKLISYSIKTLN